MVGIQLFIHIRCSLYIRDVYMAVKIIIKPKPIKSIYTSLLYIPKPLLEGGCPEFGR